MDSALYELMEGDPEDEVRALMRLRDAEALPSGVRVVTLFGEVATIRLKRGAILQTRADESIRSLKAPRFLGPEPDPELDVEAEPPVPRDQRRPASLPETGQGVVLGVVDWGIDFRHEDFRHEDGTTRLLAIWDQRGGRRADSPEPYGYGAVHTADEINRALQSGSPYQALGYHPLDADLDGNGTHGTHVMSIAAGSGRGPAGIAPRADLIFVHMDTSDAASPAGLGDSVSLPEAIDYIFRAAGDRPCVVSLSIGRHWGSHDGMSLVEQALDAAIVDAPGRAICQSAGNYYHRRIHASGQLRPGEVRTLTWPTDSADITPNELEVWYSHRDRMTVEVEAPDGTRSRKVGPDERDVMRAGERTIARVYHRANEPNNQDHHINVFVYPHGPGGVWTVRLMGDDIVDGRYHAWIERDAACPGCQSSFDLRDADPASTTGSICNGLRTVAVGAYNLHDSDRGLAPFSSSGPTRDGRIKPDIVAPGVAVLAARSAQRHDEESRWTRKSGTSMAAPHVAGAVACMFEAAGHLLPIETTRRLLLESADESGRNAQNVERIGSGYLDIERAVAAARRLRREDEARPVLAAVGAGVGAITAGLGGRWEGVMDVRAEQLPDYGEWRQSVLHVEDTGPEAEAQVADGDSTLMDAQDWSWQSPAAFPDDPASETEMIDAEEEEFEQGDSFEIRGESLEWSGSSPAVALSEDADDEDIEQSEGIESEPEDEDIETEDALALEDIEQSEGLEDEGYDDDEASLEDEAIEQSEDIETADPEDEGIAIEEDLDGLEDIEESEGLETEDIETAVGTPDRSVPCAGELIQLDNFGLDSAALTAAHRDAIAVIARGIAASQLGDEPVHTICLTGHTDTSGNASYNLTLAQRRADGVRIELGLALERERTGLVQQLDIRTASEGETRPIAPETTAAGRARNRRVEVLLNNRWVRPTPPPESPGVALLGEADDGTMFGENDPPRQFTIEVGGSQAFIATGRPLPVGRPAYRWTNSDRRVATVTVDGNSQTHPNRITVRGVAAGNCTITVTYRTSRGSTATASIRILVPAPPRELGRITIGPTTFVVAARGAAVHNAATLDAAIQHAIARTHADTAIVGDMVNGTAFEVFEWEPRDTAGRTAALPATPGPITSVTPATGTALCALLITRGLFSYFPANPVTPAARWLQIPRLIEFYGLPPADRTTHRGRWETRLAGAGTAFTRAQITAFPMPTLRLVLANNPGAYSVDVVRRTSRRVDRGGVVHGVSVPIIRYPISEPDCYLPVIGEVEGKLESVNAWDVDAGVSIGPIQFNVKRAALFRFLNDFNRKDPTLFTQEFGTPFGWSMAAHDGHTDLVITTGTPPTAVTLHGTVADEDRNSKFFQSGTPGGAGFDPPFRRNTATRFRNILVWPHVQEMVLETSAWWLGTGLATINAAAGYQALDVNRPDRDMFTIKAILMSTFVRFSGCLSPLIARLARFATIPQRITNVGTSVAALNDPCPTLRGRLNSQVGHARTVHDQIMRLAGPAPAPAPGGGGGGGALPPAPARGEAMQSIQPSFGSDDEAWEEIEAADMWSGAALEAAPPARCGEDASEVYEQYELDDYESDDGFESADESQYEGEWSLTDADPPESDEDVPSPGPSLVAESLVEVANQLISMQLGPGENLLWSVLARTPAMEAAGSPSFEALPSPARVFDLLATEQEEGAGLRSLFEVVGPPGARLTEEPAPGDLMLFRVRGEPDSGHVAVLASGLSRAEDLEATGVRTTMRQHGARYAQIVEGGAFPHRLEDLHARLVTDSAGRVPLHQMLVRPRIGVADMRAAAEAPVNMPPLTITVKPFATLREFTFDKSNIPSQHDAIIKRIAHLIVDSQAHGDPITQIRIVGHTDSIGSDAHNDPLGTRRAEAVRDRLRTEIDALSPGLSASITITPQTRGKRSPIGNNATTAGRAQNRRVEIFVPTTCQSFFAAYDLRFLPGDPVFGIPANPDLTAAQKAQRDTDVNTMVGELLTRRDRRASEALAGRAMAAAAVSSALRPILRRLSDRQLELYKEFFQDGSGGIDFDRLHECFQLFANGDLRSPQPASQAQGIGEPNGGFFFLFAEFAFLCCDSRINEAEWTNALRVFVECQELFMHVYREPKISAAPAVPTAVPGTGTRVRELDQENDPLTGAITTPGYANENFNAPAQSSSARKTALAGIYGPLDLAALRGAVRDNMLRALRLP